MEKNIITREEIEALPGESKVHFLNERARRINKSLGDLTGLTGFGFHLIKVQAGDYSTELHRHYYEDECVYILEGEGEVTIGESVQRVKSGDFIAYPAGGDAHTMRNCGDGVLKCIVVGGRLTHDVTDYPAKGKRLYRNRSMAWNLVDIGDIVER
ncbi:cupin domain-containing protein [Proteobacteria bacterium 005FR1]|nr:cupin domain-containing protein [Proteobacteria bacterium 005FR1]